MSGHPPRGTITRYRALERIGDAVVEDLLHVMTSIGGTESAMLALTGGGGAGLFSEIVAVGNAPSSGSLTFASFAILQDSIVEIPDLSKRAPFDGERSVVGPPHFRYLAGMRVRAEGGETLGALCLLDPRSQTLPEATRATLKRLGQHLGHLISLRRSWADLRARVERRLERLDVLEGVFGASHRLAIVGFDDAGQILMWNRAAAAVFGKEERDVRGRANVAEFFVDPPPDAALVQLKREAASDAEAKAEREWTLHRGGEPFSAAGAVARAVDDEGAMRGYVLVAHDVTERKAAERAKKEFMAMVSHELRTPVTAVRAAVELLLGNAAGELPPAARDMLSIAESNTQRLSLLVDDILDLEKLERPDFRMVLRKADLVEVAARSVQTTAPFAARFGVSLHFSPPPQPMWIRGDAARLAQVFVNLLSNGAKFSPEGAAVDVTLERLLVDGKGVFRASVRDRGPGIPDEIRPRLFSKFVQAPVGLTSERKGTGLGLAIARAIVERHGGTIGYDSRLGEGTVIHFDLAEGAG